MQTERQWLYLYCVSRAWSVREVWRETEAPARGSRAQEETEEPGETGTVRGKKRVRACFVFFCFAIWFFFFYSFELQLSVSVLRVRLAEQREPSYGPQEA